MSIGPRRKIERFEIFEVKTEEMKKATPTPSWS